MLFIYLAQLHINNKIIWLSLNSNLDPAKENILQGCKSPRKMTMIGMCCFILSHQQWLMRTCWALYFSVLRWDDTLCDQRVIFAMHLKDNLDSSWDFPWLVEWAFEHFQSALWCKNPLIPSALFSIPPIPPYTNP